MANGHGKKPEDFKKQMEDNFKVAPGEHTHVKKVIGIVSGKGGVGKSLVTGLSAVYMAKDGYKTAILDADITGPSIPKMFGIGQAKNADETGLLPAESEKGTKVMSLNMLMDNETDPVIWRGPVIMPPGTGDVPLTVFQSLPVDGIIVVATPQELVGMIVEKAINMAEMMKIPVLGIVENMSYMNCPHCGKPINIFGESKIEGYAASKGINILGRIPLDPAISQLCDNGKIEDINDDYLDSLKYILKGMTEQ